MWQECLNDSGHHLTFTDYTSRQIMKRSYDCPAKGDHERKTTSPDIEAAGKALPLQTLSKLPKTSIGFLDNIDTTFKDFD